MKILVGVVCLLIVGLAGVWVGFDLGVAQANDCMIEFLFNETSVTTDELKQKIYACAHAGDIETMQDLNKGFLEGI